MNLEEFRKIDFEKIKNPSLKFIGGDMTIEFESRPEPIEGEWHWVFDGERIFLAKKDKEASGGWTNEDTWEDFDKSIIGFVVAKIPERLSMQFFNRQVEGKEVLRVQFISTTKGISESVKINGRTIAGLTGYKVLHNIEGNPEELELTIGWEDIDMKS